MIPTRLATGALALALLAAPAAAQAQLQPITAAGDPSIRADTIYRRAIAPSQAAGQATVILFGDKVIRVAPDLRQLVTKRTIWQQLAPRDPANARGFDLGYTDDDMTIQLNWLRVVRPDGTVLREVRPESMQTREIGGYRQWTIDAAPPEPGEIVDMSHTFIPSASAPVPADLFTWFDFESGLTSRVVLDVPATMRLRISERRTSSRRAEATGDGRRTYTWTASGISDSIPVLEPFAPDSLADEARIVVSTEQSWKQVGDAFRSSVGRRHYALDTAAVRQVAAAASLQQGRSRLDTLALLHRWAARGPYQDRIMRFIGALRAHGFRAYPVLAGSETPVDSLHPARVQLPHLGAWVGTGDSRRPWVYLDPGTPHSYMGADVPPAQQGQFALVIHDDSVQQLRLDESLPQFNVAILQLGGRLEPSGSIRGRLVYQARGIPGYDLNQQLADAREAGMTTDYGTSIIKSVFPVSVVDSLQVVGPGEQNPQPHIAAHVGLPSYAKREGNTVTIPMPWKPFPSIDSIATVLERSQRTMPIDAEKVIGNKAELYSLFITLPAGWRAQLPAPVELDGPFGTFGFTVRQEDSQLVINRVLMGKRGVIPASRAGELAGWLRMVAAQQLQSVTVTVP